MQEGYEVNLGLVMELAAIHDLPEIVTTDIPYSAFDIVGQELQQAKVSAEKKAIRSLFTPLEELGEKMIEDWETLLNSNIIESQIVAGADIVDMLVHAICLERSGVSATILDPFFSKKSQKLEKIKIPIIEQLYDFLQSEHNKNLQNQQSL